MTTATNTKHTPGPWHVIASRVDAYTYYFGSDVANLHMDHREANARLIAVAPDMLAALEAILDDPDFDGCISLKAASAAVCKAKGEL